MKDRMVSSVMSMAKDIVSGAIILGGVVVTIVAADASLPLVATVGALSAVGAGAYQAAAAPKRTRHHSKGF